MMIPAALPPDNCATAVAEELLAELAQLYRRMDRDYQAVADAYGFQCSGCRDNCCYTRFYHHTYCEWLYLREGFLALELPVQQDILLRSRTYCRHLRSSSLAGTHRLAVICPANQEGRCRLYAHRPMICRLHGLPHRLQAPGRPAVEAPGCHIFEDEFAGNADARIDRTPIYAAMASLERKVRQALGLDDRIRMTVAEMIRSLGRPLHPDEDSTEESSTPAAKMG